MRKKLCAALFAATAACTLAAHAQPKKAPAGNKGHNTPEFLRPVPESTLLLQIDSLNTLAGKLANRLDSLTEVMKRREGAAAAAIKTLRLYEMIKAGDTAAQRKFINANPDFYLQTDTSSVTMAVLREDATDLIKKALGGQDLYSSWPGLAELHSRGKLQLRSELLSYQQVPAIELPLMPNFANGANATEAGRQGLARAYHDYILNTLQAAYILPDGLLNDFMQEEQVLAGHDTEKLLTTYIKFIVFVKANCQKKSINHR